ncbi:MAG: hypothetical protein Unbinned4162contig1001_46 [Prokaryotic dsDNA virus sp.]|nr:MAG: hypothetical protein Unbinned4162contig1001_46 [Prokaryotic dsDNA virus sp.]|tara:strand:- start:1845 stop:2276 length:432 start_codon:yes stop_codon:yes gene_type:complete
MSNNFITLREPIEFGKYRGTGKTGADLLNCPQGISYLKYLYNHTDVAMEHSLVNSLGKEVDLVANDQRRNSNLYHKADIHPFLSKVDGLQGTGGTATFNDWSKYGDKFKQALREAELGITSRTFDSIVRNEVRAMSNLYGVEK